MNLLGKIFIILIFIMSVMFLGFSVAIFATHTDWKERATVLAAQLSEEQKQADQIVELRDMTIKRLYEEMEDRSNRVADLHTKVVALSDTNDAIAEELKTASEGRTQSLAAIQDVHQHMKVAREELLELRKGFRELQIEWAKANSELIEKTDEAHATALRLAKYQAIGEQLAKDYRDAMDVLNKYGLKPEPAIYNSVPQSNVQGIVTEVRPNGWVQISIGSDSGLAKGHQLDIVRKVEGNEMYIGKLQITDTTVNSAVAKILPDYRRGTVQRDDLVLVVDSGELSAK